MEAIFGLHFACLTCCHSAAAVESKSGRACLRMPAEPSLSDCLRFSKTSFARVLEVMPVDSRTRCEWNMKSMTKLCCLSVDRCSHWCLPFVDSPTGSFLLLVV